MKGISAQHTVREKTPPPPKMQRTCTSLSGDTLCGRWTNLNGRRAKSLSATLGCPNYMNQNSHEGSRKTVLTDAYSLPSAMAKAMASATQSMMERWHWNRFSPGSLRHRESCHR